jgi:acetyl esterase
MNKIAVAGDSAGGNLAVNASVIAKKKNILPIQLQVLICPWLNLSDTESSTYQLFGEGLWLSRASILWYRKHYLNTDDEALLTTASPFFIENLKSLPPTFIIIAEFDVLRNEGERFAQKLLDASVPVKSSLYKGMLHDFITLPNYFDDAGRAIDEICEGLKIAFKDE